MNTYDGRINCHRPWLLALRISPRPRNRARTCPSGTATANRTKRPVKAYLSRGNLYLPRLPVAQDDRGMWPNTAIQTCQIGTTMNVCSYHCKEAGGDAPSSRKLLCPLPLATAVLGRSGAPASRRRFSENSLGRISFFVNGRHAVFVTEMCKMRAFLVASVGRDFALNSYGVEGPPKIPPFRYGVQVNSLGTDEQQPGKKQRLPYPDRDLLSG